MADACTHKDQIKPKAELFPSASNGCEECLKMGDTWRELRICLICGHVGCCDSSKNKHATAHFKETGHPIIQAYGTDATWLWCYIDQQYLNDPAEKMYNHHPSK